MFFTKRKIESISLLEPIKEMLNKTWDLSRRFSLPDEPVLNQSISLFNAFFSSLNTFMKIILKSVVALSSTVPHLFTISKAFRQKCEEQALNVSEISQAGTNMARQIEIMSKSLTEVADDAKTIEQDLQVAIKLGEQSMTQIVDIISFVSILVDVINVLDKSSTSIGSIIETIEDISNESNLLSLNARIEAARSGIHGKGFMVVADEIGQLARQTKTATSDIKNNLTILQEKVIGTVDAVKQVEKNVQTGEKMIYSSNQSLNAIYERFISFSKTIRSIDAATEKQHAEIKSVAADIVSIEDAVKFQSNESRTIYEIAEDMKRICDQMIVDTGVFRLSNHKKAEKVAQEIAERPELLGSEKALQEKVLNDMLLRYPFIELIYLTNAKGIQITDNMYSEKAQNAENAEGYNCNWEQKEWFQFPKSTGKT